MTDTTEVGPADARERLRDPAERLALVVVWSADDPPDMLGAVVLVPPRGAPVEVGRGTESFVHQRPGHNAPAPPLTGKRTSRRQLRLTGLGVRLQVENLGKCPLKVRGQPTTQAVVEPGEYIEIEGQLLLWCTRRPAVLSPARTEATVPWGRADLDGLVGESPALWALRDQLAFIGPRPGHVLLLGRSGTGKELAARALHRASPRAHATFLTRNAATIPEGLMDAELFGHVRGYPNAGMPERTGLVGEADGGTLFLDEIGELPTALQAHLLRLMDAGDYQRLGEARPRTADLRIIAATNRPREHLKPDFLARFRHVVELPDLDDRREDVSLLARHLLVRAATEDSAVAAFVEGGHARLAPDLVAALLLHPLPLQVRDLDTLLWRCLAASRGDVVVRAPGIEVPARGGEATDPADISEDDLRQALSECDGVQEKAWKFLGLNSRYQLRRLLKRYSIPGAD